MNYGCYCWGDMGWLGCPSNYQVGVMYFFIHMCVGVWGYFRLSYFGVGKMELLMIFFCFLFLFKEEQWVVRWL